MTNEALQRATELEPLIKAVKTNIKKWETATGFKRNPEIQSFFGDGGNGYSYVDGSHIPFEVAQALSLAGFKKELKKLEDEFNSL